MKTHGMLVYLEVFSDKSEEHVREQVQNILDSDNLQEQFNKAGLEISCFDIQDEEE